MAEALWDFLDYVYHNTAHKGITIDDVLMITHVWEDALHFCTARGLLSKVPALHDSLMKDACEALTGCFQTPFYFPERYRDEHPRLPQPRTNDLTVVLDFADYGREWSVYHVNMYICRRTPSVRYLVQQRPVGVQRSTLLSNVTLASKAGGIGL